MNRHAAGAAFALTTAFLAAPAGAEGTMPRFGWGATIEQSRATLGRIASAPHACAGRWGLQEDGCRALRIERHRLGRYRYRLELQHHLLRGLHRIVVVPVAAGAQDQERAAAYSILVFDAAFSESHGRLANSPVFRLTEDNTGGKTQGYEWQAAYGPPGVRVKLHARIGDARDDGAHLAIEGPMPGSRIKR